MESIKKSEETKFENPDIDPGFAYEPKDNENELEGVEDERDGNIDSDISIRELRGEDDEDSEDDALNYRNDRGKGAFNPKNI